MGSRTLTPETAAAAILEADPLTDVRISLGWRTSNGQRFPVLRISSKSTVNYTTKAKPLGTFAGTSDDTHTRLLLLLTLEMNKKLSQLWAGER